MECNGAMLIDMDSLCVRACDFKIPKLSSDFILQIKG